MLAELLDRLNKPAYIFRPAQALRRLKIRRQPAPVVRMPWGTDLQVTATESVGSGIARTGVHELPVTETMFRLLGPGDTALDVGYYTSLMCSRVGPTGSVIAIEPHPLLAQQLRGNVARWNAPWVVVYQRAASASNGVAHLTAPADFAHNMGTSTLGIETEKSVAVDTIALGSLVNGQVAVLKIDVEGHEMAALDGLDGKLASVQNVVFEDFGAFPTPVSSRLEAAGFTIFALEEHFHGVALVPATVGATPRWDAPTYLATRTPIRATAIVQPDGWRCLSRRRGASRRAGAM